MSLPEKIRRQLHSEIEKFSLPELKKAVFELSKHYKNKNTSLSIFKKPVFRAAYFSIRVPAIYGAVCKVLKELKNRTSNLDISSVLDLGCGPGTASWSAIEELGSIQKAFLWDYSKEMIKVGQMISKSFSPVFDTAEWKQTSLLNQSEFPDVDLILVSYMMNEMDPLDRKKLVEELLLSSNIRYCLFIEPGDPSGFQTIKEVRQACIDSGLNILAPCPHRHKCPIESPDWCHFTQRITRDRLQRIVKQAELNYEDEKFSYVLVTSESVSPYEARILQHPAKHTGHVSLKLCHESGHIRHKVVSKKEGSDYKFAKKSQWGDLWAK